MVNRTGPQKARAAIGFFLDHSAARSYGSGAVRIRRTKDGDNRQADRSGYVHCAGIVAYKQLAAREERGESGDCCFANQTDRGASYSGGNRVGNFLLGCCSKENSLLVRLQAETLTKTNATILLPPLPRT